MSAFFDTNVLLYTLTRDDPRQEVALRLLAGGGLISVQVFNEFATVAHCKMKMSWADVGTALRAMRAIVSAPLPITLAIHESAISLVGRHNFAFYDALIVAAALEARCTILYSEDMHHGMTIGDSVRIVNPFT